MAKNESKLPVKKNASFVTALFLITQFFFLVTVLGNFPILNDTFDVSGMPKFAIFFNVYFIYLDIACSVIQIILFVFICRAFSNKGYPSLLTFITVFYNILICTAFSIWVYFSDTRNLSFLYQLVFLIPIIIIFMSSVFLIDDNADLLRGNFEAYVSRPTKMAQKKFKQQTYRVQNTVRRGSNVETHEDIPILTIEETIQEHQQKIANAALKTIPDVETNKIKNYEYLKDMK